MPKNQPSAASKLGSLMMANMNATGVRQDATSPASVILPARASSIAENAEKDEQTTIMICSSTNGESGAASMSASVLNVELAESAPINGINVLARRRSVGSAISKSINQAYA